VAIEAEREATAFACCALLDGREGESFQAEVTGVTEHGLFIRCFRPAASGLVPLRGLGRRFELDPEAETLALEGAGPPIRVGTRLEVRLTQVDGDRGRLAFELAGARRETGPRRLRHDSASDSESDSQSR
jgi:ribonuclease R